MLGCHAMAFQGSTAVRIPCYGIPRLYCCEDAANDGIPGPYCCEDTGSDGIPGLYCCEDAKQSLNFEHIWVLNI